MPRISVLLCGAVPRDNWTFTKAPGGVVVLEFKPALNTAYIKVHCKYDDRTETMGFDSTKATFTQAGGAFIGTMVKVYHLAQERTENYTYDAVGNRLSSTYTYEGSDTKEEQSYQYYTKSDRLKTDGKYAFKYDANGNLIEKGTSFTIAGDVVTFTATYGEGVEHWQYDYDALNRLMKVTKSGLIAGDQTIVEYVYDPTGLRLKKIKGTSSTLYAFDQAGNQIYDMAGGQEHCYIWAFGKTLARVDGDKDSTVKHFFHTDMLGSTVLVTDGEGKTVWTGDVTPFGEKVNGEGSFESAVRFTGKEYDEDTGLYYFNARWYDPELGRFTREDPGVDPNNPNLYVYCSNSPLVFIDPTGEREILEGEPGTSTEFSVALDPSAQRGYHIVNGGKRFPNEVSKDIANTLYTGKMTYWNSNSTLRTLDHQSSTVRQGVKNEIALFYSPESLAQMERLGYVWVMMPQVASNLYLAFAVPSTGQQPSRQAPYGATPKGRVYTKHYGTEQGPKRNIPGSVIDFVIDTYKPYATKDGKFVYYDPINNVTVVTGKNGIISAHKGTPRPGQY